MIAIRRSGLDDGESMVRIWRDAVDATHAFLAPEDRGALHDLVAGFLPTAPTWLAVDEDDRPLGFMLIEDGHMAALFVDPIAHGRRVGAALVRQGLALHPAMTTDVNEQNDAAVGFYERMGFRRTGRSETDGRGKPYPLIHLAFGRR